MLRPSRIPHQVAFATVATCRSRGGKVGVLTMIFGQRCEITRNDGQQKSDADFLLRDVMDKKE